MKNKEKLRKRKNKLSLNTRLTLLIGIVVFGSILLASGLSAFIEWLFPHVSKIPILIQINILSLFIAVIAARFLSNHFFNPIKVLRESILKVADGDFGICIETKSTSSEIQEIFEGFNLMAKELASTEILQTDFVSNVSHEFKTPINAIEGYTTLLQSTENIDEVENEYIEKILFNTKRLSSLVSNILLLSKIENQSIQTHREKFSLDEQIRETIVALEQGWTEKDIYLDVELENIDYFGTETMMYHIWSNIIGNAIKFSPRGGNIKIKLFKEDEHIVFTVEDEGPGLSEQTQKHLFDKFYQEDSSHKQDGNGLGLALVKKLVTMSDGEVFAENIDNVGCRFTVKLDV
ncbi:MAG: HAMP domain-containing protein [Clostridia bacterium]|nr:HAMP domain-containing protein [Clostridia bacterium]